MVQFSSRSSACAGDLETPDLYQWPPRSSFCYSPCSKGEKVPASRLMYGSILIEVTSIPQQLSSVPNELAITPFPTPLITPPVTRMYFILQDNLCYVRSRVLFKWRGGASTIDTNKQCACKLGKQVKTTKSKQQKQNRLVHCCQLDFKSNARFKMHKRNILK